MDSITKIHKVLGFIIIGMILFQSCDLKKRDFKRHKENGNASDTKLDDKKFTFIDYEKVVMELKTSMNFKSVEDKYNWIFVLLLDSAEKKLIQNDDLIKEFRNYSPGLQINERTVGFYTDVSGIKEIFTDSKSNNRIIECVHAENSPDEKLVSIDNVIYIKGNSAIFEISGPTWSDTYCARLKNNAIQINWLGGVIE